MNFSNFTIPKSSKWQNDAMSISGSIICPFGILSSLLGLCSLWKKSFKEKNEFFVLMFIISFLDLLFNCLYLVYKWATPTVSDLTQGPVYTVSLASDLCTLCLTLERYLSLCYPIKMQNLAHKKKIAIRIGASVVVIAISLIRLNYTTSKYVNSTLSTTVNMIGELILPFILIIAMSILSTGIALAFIKSQRSKVKLMSQRSMPMNKREEPGMSMTHIAGLSTYVQKVFISFMCFGLSGKMANFT
jgi:hypothetical protein